MCYEGPRYGYKEIWIIYSQNITLQMLIENHIVCTVFLGPSIDQGHQNPETNEGHHYNTETSQARLLLDGYHSRRLLEHN